MPEALTMEQVRHVARLARLRPTDEQLEAARTDLAAILDMVARLQQLDVQNVEPFAHPLPITNRLADDEPSEPMPIEHLLSNAPASLERFLAVPKVLAEDGSA